MPTDGAPHQRLPVTPILDAHDPRLADYRNLPDRDLLERHGLFIAEGRLIVERLLTNRTWVTRSVLVTDAARSALSAVLEARPDVPTYVVPQALMNGITGISIHRGALAVGARPTPRRWQDVVAQAQRIVVLERIGNADNVGGIFRAAAAFGIDAVLLDAATADPLYRKAIRTSMGAALAVPFARFGPASAGSDAVGQGSATSPRDESFADGLREIGAAGWTTVGLTPSPDAPVLTSALDGLRNQRVAVVVGHEGEGLTPGTLTACHRLARIHMPGRVTANVDSLNVAIAAAMAFYELTR